MGGAGGALATRSACPAWLRALSATTVPDRTAQSGTLLSAPSCPVPATRAAMPAPCPCPLPDGSCPSKSACDRNNHIAHKVVAAGEEPEDLDKVKWYDSVEGQIPQDVDVPKLLVPTEEEAPKENLIAANPDVYMPVSDDATKVEIAETEVADPPKP